MITNTTEEITFLAVLREHTHAEPPLPSSPHCPLVLNLVQRRDDYDKSGCKI